MFEFSSHMHACMHTLCINACTHVHACSYTPHCVLVISIDEHFRTDTATETLWLLPQLDVLHEAIVHKLCLHIPTAVEGSSVLTPADTLACYTPLSGRYTEGTTELAREQNRVSKDTKLYVAI